MRVLTPLFFASGSLAAALVARSDVDFPSCFSAHAASDLVPLATCGDATALKLCFSHLTSFASKELLGCYVQSGCGHNDAIDNYAVAAEFCSKLYATKTVNNGDLRRRRGELDDEAAHKTTAPPLAVTQFFNDPAAALFVRSAESGNACMTTSTVSTKSCPIETNDGREVTGSCFPAQVAKSECHPDKTCTFDGVGMRVCMNRRDSLDVGGIIVATIFGVAIVGSVAAITFLCCRDRKEQKRLVAKAEATALVRAATKKKKAAESRTPLMREQREGSIGPAAPGGANPFHDGSMS